MAESKFTPGGWKVLEARDIPNSKRISSADLCFAVVSSHLLKPEAIHANAELMADAPRMLEVLRIIHDLGIPVAYGENTKKAREAFWATKDLLEKHGG
jgi:hypothetical protein